MDSVALIAPDFSIILLGLLLRLKFDYSEDFWKQAERLVFYVLFPPLLFTSISGSSLSLGESAGFLAAGVGAMLIGVCASWCIRYLVKADPVTHASLFQCGFRFNTYIGFALALKLFGDQGFALLALLIAFWVPISNTIAVSALAGAVANVMQLWVSRQTALSPASWLLRAKRLSKIRSLSLRFLDSAAIFSASQCRQPSITS